MYTVHQKKAYLVDKSTAAFYTDKPWGAEFTFVNGDHTSTRGGSYCLKQLRINPHSQTSMHFHVDKHETIYVSRGTLTLVIRDPKECTDTEYVLYENEAFVIPPGLVHRLINQQSTELILVEGSTYDSSTDSVRVNK